MKCRICGGALSLQNKMYVCKSCNNSFPISTYYQNNDVFVAYMETDFQGRRTKESIISQEIYNKLQSENINTFYQRISADGLFGESLVSVTELAASYAKIIIIVGTSRASFENTVAKYKDLFENKLLIPVYADMTAYDLPTNLKDLQALNYNKVGAINDLTVNILNLLNRRGNLNVEELKPKSKRNAFVLISLLVIALFLSGSIYLVFGTAYILPNKKYEKAQRLLEQNKYEEAIKAFSAINDYKDSSNQLKNIYNKYVGYYYDEESDISLHINIVNNVQANIEMRKKSENIVITEISEIQSNKISFSYNDNENNRGNVDIVLQNDGLNCNVITEEAESKYNYGNTSVFFALENKSDSPIMEGITASTIKKWLSKRHTKNDIQHDGFDLSIRDSNNAVDWSSYNITNTDVIIDCFGEEGYNNVLLPYGSEQEFKSFDGEVAFLITAPAKIIIPDKVGQSGEMFFEDNNVFIPNIDYFMWSPPNIFGFCMSREAMQSTIEEDTKVLCTSKELLGEESFDNIGESGWLFDY